MGGDVDFTAADFDALMGHAVAVADAPGCVFAAKLIEAYPEAKVVLNYLRPRRLAQERLRDDA